MFELVRALREGLGIDSTVGFVLTIGCFFGVVGAGAAWLVDRAYKNSSATQAQSAPRGPDPVIQLEYDPLGDALPLSIEPRSKLSVVYVEENDTVSLFQYTNNTTKTSLWPKSKILPLSLVSRVRLSNTGEVNAYNVVANLKFLIGGDNLPDGTKKPEISLPRVDLRSGARDRSSVYIANKSASPVLILFPPTASALVQGERNRRAVPVAAAASMITMTYRDPETGNQFGGSILPPSPTRWWQQ